MEWVCARDPSPACSARAVGGAVHALHLYCGALSATLICCCATYKPRWNGRPWRGQNIRGVASLLLLVAWLCDAACATLRPSDTVKLVSSLLAPVAWVAATALHLALWTCRSGSPLLYLAIYWLLAAASSAAMLYQHIMTDARADHLELYTQSASLLMTLFLFGVDCVCFYDEVTKRVIHRTKRSEEVQSRPYKYNETHFFSKISFFWLNPLLYNGYKAPFDENDLGELPEGEQPGRFYNKFKKISNKNRADVKNSENKLSIWRCYVQTVWPNFYIAGVMKLFSDLIGVVPPLGLAVIIQFIENPITNNDVKSHVTTNEFITNGYVMVLIVTMALVAQAFLSQNSTHLVTVEGTRLKIALQSMVYDKCMRLASWSTEKTYAEDESPLLPSSEYNFDTQSGLLTNLVTQDTYNVMSCVWICHYIWAIPLKVGFILYLLYLKLGISAIIGSAASILFVTPLQFYIGKKISDNSKQISKCTDHRISKMTEILQGLNVIKLYVWEDLFNEKILNLREVELRLLNKDSAYWSILTFTTQVSTLLVTVITFTIYYYLDSSDSLTAVNVFAGLALFNQLSIPLLILPVTVLMVIQAMVSTNRIKDFLELPESNNIQEDSNVNQGRHSDISDRLNGKSVEVKGVDIIESDAQGKIIEEKEENDIIEQHSDDEVTPLIEDTPTNIVSFRNAVFSWGTKDESTLEIDELDIPAGKLIMVIGSTGSGKSSLLSAILGEMYLDRGNVVWKGSPSMWYSGQPPWLLECSIRDNIVMDNPWCQSKYARVIRATGLGADLQILPEGDSIHLGSQGSPLSGGQRVRVCVARALYSTAKVLVLDEPLAALDAALAKHLVSRALLPAARVGRTVIVATNRLELLHYADLVIVMEDGRVADVGRAAGASGTSSAMSRWLQLAGDARRVAERAGAGPPGGSERERLRLSRVLSRTSHLRLHEINTIGIREATGAHFLTELPTRAAGSWRRTTRQRSRPLLRQVSSPPPSMHSNRWTPRSLRRLMSTRSESTVADSQEKIDESTCYTSLTLNGIESATTDVLPGTVAKSKESEDNVHEMAIWWEYIRACGWWGATFWLCSACAQVLALAADVWLAHVTAESATNEPTDKWSSVRIYAAWCAGVGVAAGAAGGAVAAGGAAARRALHERLLNAALHTPPAAPAAPLALGHALHRFSADILVIDKKLPTALSRWAQLLLLCAAAALLNVVMAPWTLLALLPALCIYMGLQSVYLRNARELQHLEASTAGSVVSLARQTCAGAGSVRAARLQRRMRNSFLRRLAANHNALLILNSANRWLGLTMDLVGAGSVLVSLCVSLSGGSAARAGLAGAYAMLLPTYLAHLAKCRADLDQQLAAVERVRADTHVPQEDYRENCSIPTGWQRNGNIEFDNVTIKYEPTSQPILEDISLSISPGQKVAICGRSGSGKSTLLLSCVGGTTISSGRILIDQQDLMQVPLRPLRHRIVVLPQEAILFTGTLRENLDPLAVHTDEEIWRSLKAVGLHEFVSAQPAGLECMVGRLSRSGWSAGRAARASAARAALHAAGGGAAALLMDEPAAALDAHAERTLLAAMAQAAPNVTIITVAHRVSSIRGYDRAVVIDDGRVVEQGSVESLLAQHNSRLAKMHALAQRSARQ